MCNVRRFLLARCTGVLLFLALLCSGPAAFSADAGGGERALTAKYAAIRGSLEKNQFGAPIYLESSEGDDVLRVDMYGIFSQPFDAVREALRNPANWCEITPVHINVKACTYTGKGEQPLLTLYSGRKYYQPPGDAFPLKLAFRVVSQTPDYLELALSAREGPLRTKDHRIALQAAPLDARRTLIHFSYAYNSGSVARMAIRGYFNTLGREKVGFSLVQGKGGKLRYVEGVRGAVERNTMRYYLALQSYLETLDYPEPQRFERRIGRWYDLTARYPRQLKESEKGDYLAAKRLERKNQVALQHKLG